jgi:hypothetical protein
MDDDAVGDDDDVAVRISVSQIRVTAEDCGRSEPLPNVTRAFSMPTKDRTHRASPKYSYSAVNAS